MCSTHCWRHAPDAIILFSSTNKVYGDLENHRYTETPTRWTCDDHPDGFDEATPLDFRTPYGCSKGAADQYIRDFCLSYGLRSVVFRHSSIFGGRQFASVDQGWVGWFVRQAVETALRPDRAPFTISGTGKQVRDVLFAPDLVRCYFDAVDAIDRVSGEAFNIGGGMANSLSLLELLALLEAELDVALRYTRLPVRASDQKVFVADISKARRLLGWAPCVSKEDGVRRHGGSGCASRWTADRPRPGLAAFPQSSSRRCVIAGPPRSRSSPASVLRRPAQVGGEDKAAQREKGHHR